MSSTVGKKQNKDSYLKEQRLLKEKAQKNQSTPHIAEPNSTQSKNETADWLSPHILNKTAFDTTRAGTTIQTEVRETHQGEIETSKIQTGDARKEKNIEIKPESLKAFEKTFSEKINQLTDKNKRSSASPETVGTLVERAPQMIPTNQRQKETVNKDEERKLSALKKIQEEAQRLKNIGKTDEAKALLKQAIENPTFYTKYLGQNKDKQGSERALLRESTHKISKEDQEKALASSDIISARNILIEASGSSTEQASEEIGRAHV